MKNQILKITIILLTGILTGFNARATDCFCDEFASAVGTAFLYGLNGTEITANKSLSMCNDNALYEFTWNFGDGTTITTNDNYTNNPGSSVTHDFIWGGTYTVCLTIKYTYFVPPYTRHCTETICQTITVDGPSYEPCTANADFVLITNGNDAIMDDRSTTSGNGKIISRTWTVNDPYDPGTYEGKLARHTFSIPGAYEICLDVMVINELTGECCFDQYCQTAEVWEFDEEDCAMDADFTYSCFGDDCIFLFNGSSGTSNRNVKTWFWEFGDGATSNLEDPYHAYATSGEYEVCLTVVGADPLGGNNCCYTTYCRTIDFDCTGITQQTACDQGESPGPGVPNPSQKENTRESILNSPDLGSIGKFDIQQIIPNPARETASLNLTFKEDVQQISLSLVSIDGKTKRTYFEGTSFDAGDHNIQIDCGALSPGTYVLLLATPDKVVSETLIITK